MPGLWKFGLVLLLVCLVASMGIGIYRLATTPTETIGDRLHGFPAQHRPR
jgi:hypothetical protein